MLQYKIEIIVTFVMARWVDGWGAFSKKGEC